MIGIKWNFQKSTSKRVPRYEKLWDERLNIFTNIKFRKHPYIMSYERGGTFNRHRELIWTPKDTNRPLKTSCLVSFVFNSAIGRHRQRLTPSRIKWNFLFVTPPPPAYYLFSFVVLSACFCWRPSWTRKTSRKGHFYLAWFRWCCSTRLSMWVKLSTTPPLWLICGWPLSYQQKYNRRKI